MRRFTPLSKRQENAKKMCAQCEHLHGDKCDHPVILDRSVGSATRLIHMSGDGLTCQIFRKECMNCKHYYEIQIDVDKWKEGCELAGDLEIEPDYRRYCQFFERDPEATE